jgi:hypothetical protein
LANSQACIETGAEIADLARLDQVVECFEGLLQRRGVVIAVDLVEVDVVGAEPGEAVIDLGHDRLAGEPFAVGAGPHGVAQLGGDHHVVAVREVLQRPAEDLLARALRVHVRGVEEVDARVQGVADQRARIGLAERPDRVAALGLAVGHRADGEGRDVQAGGAELDVFHGKFPW